jgi:hypothetical protein
MVGHIPVVVSVACAAKTPGHNQGLGGGMEMLGRKLQATYWIFRQTVV